MDVLYEAEMPDVLGGVLRIFLDLPDRESR
jgi:hypothetical protein